METGQVAATSTRRCGKVSLGQQNTASCKRGAPRLLFGTKAINCLQQAEGLLAEPPCGLHHQSREHTPLAAENGAQTSCACMCRCRSLQDSTSAYKARKRAGHGD